MRVNPASEFNGMEEIFESILKLERWSSNADWKGYDTFDGLSSPFARFATLNIPLLKQCWQQGVRRFPLNLRPILGIKPAHSSKGMGFFAQGYLRLYQITGREEYLEKMRGCLDWLNKHRSPDYRGHAWGNHFDYQSRGGQIPPGTPTVVWTSLIGHAFLDAYEALGDQKYLEVARSSAEFIINELGWWETGQDICLCYVPLPDGKPIKGEGGVHNSNLLGAGLLARVNSHCPKARYLEVAREAVKFTVRLQLENGAWYYGIQKMFHWVDSFHTAYNLESLDWYIRSSGDQSFTNSLEQGFAFYFNTFFESDGTPRYYDNKRSPLDIQCASQGIQTLVNLSRLNARSVEMSTRVALWTIRNMQDPTGYFYYRKYPLITNKTPTLHWGQATMFAALTLLEQRLGKGAKSGGNTLAPMEGLTTAGVTP
jgi:hypothetical protein